MIQCSCPQCDYTYKVANTLAGKHVFCPERNSRFKVRGSSTIRKSVDEEDYAGTDDAIRNRSVGEHGRAGSRLGLWIGLGAGALVLVMLVVTGVTLWTTGLLAHLGFLSLKQKTAAEDAIKALRRVESAVQVGVLFQLRPESACNSAANLHS
jgi:hypothetical protein